VEGVLKTPWARTIVAQVSKPAVGEHRAHRAIRFDVGARDDRDLRVGDVGDLARRVAVDAELDIQVGEAHHSDATDSRVAAQWLR
jgi:hypothetical protein